MKAFFTIFAFCHADNCLTANDSYGMKYAGNISESASGKVCVPWDYFGINYPKHNHCRNLGGRYKKIGPSCFTEHQFGSLEQCRVPQCKTDRECWSTEPIEYIGRQHSTKTGLSCQRWDSNTPHTPRSFPPVRSNNFCRNPGFELKLNISDVHRRLHNTADLGDLIIFYI
jgi:hypothetical protein